MNAIYKALTARRDAIMQGEKEKGFTLIELLVVIIIIGILAAIAIPVFLNQREGAWKSSVESDLRNVAIAIETATTSNNGSLTGLDIPASTDAGTGAVTAEITKTAGGAVVSTFTVSSGNTVDVAIAGNAYTLTGSNTNMSGKSILYVSASGGLGSWN